MATITFFIKSVNNPAGIYIRLLEGRSIDAMAKTNLIVNPADWSKVKGRPKHTKNADLSKLDNDIENLKTKLLNYYNKKHENDLINTQWLKNFINPASNSVIPSYLIDLIDYYIIDRKNELKTRTNQLLATIKNTIINFQIISKKKYLVKDFNLQFSRDYDIYMTSLNYSHNTIAKYLRTIKTVCNYGAIKGTQVSSEITAIKKSYKSVDNIYLTKEELDKIYSLKIDNENLSIARDWLIISCDTGQRVSDFMRFEKTMIRYEKNLKGELKPLIEFVQMKTNKDMTIPLSQRVVDVLKSNNGEFPKPLKDVHYNLFIKEVCALAGINEAIESSLFDKKTKRKKEGTFKKWQLVSSHIGRRSFATNYYGIIPTSLLIGCTGHSTEKQFLEYIGKSDSQKAMQLAEYF